MLTGAGDGPDRPVRVVVADDQQLIRDGIASLLALQPGIDVVGTAADGREAVTAALELAPDVVLMDVRMPELDGVRAAAIVQREAPGCRVIMLTTFDDEQYVIQALTAGAAGYLLKDLPAGQLASAVRLACAGVTQLDPSVAHRLAAAAAPGRSTSDRADPPSPDAGQPSTRDGAAGHGAGDELTAREIDVLRLLATGSTNREIASQLYLSEGTVKNHVSRILSRLGLRDRTQAAVYAHDHQLI